MEVIIENGKPENLVSINEIYNHYVMNSNATFDTEEWDEQRRSDWFQQFNLQPNLYNLFVAKSKGEVIGFAYNSKFKEKQAYFTSSELTVYIKPGFEGNGLGGKLYNALLPVIAGSQLHQLYAAITIPNAASIRLHEKYGFRLVGSMKEVGYKNGQFHSVSLYEKQISN